MTKKTRSTIAPIIHAQTWEDGTPRSTTNSFCVGWGSAVFDIEKMALNANHKANSTRRVEQMRDKGVELCAIHGISAKADSLIA